MPKLSGVVAAVVLGLLLLDEVGLDGDPDVVGLAGEVGGQVVVGLVRLEGRVAEVAPQDGEQPEVVGLGEGRADLLELAVGSGRSRSRWWRPRRRRRGRRPGGPSRT